MHKLRVTATMKRQFTELRDPKGGARKGGVMHVPKIQTPDEWKPSLPYSRTR